MKTMKFPQRYRPFIEKKVREAVLEAIRDDIYRRDDDPRTKVWVSVPEDLIVPSVHFTAMGLVCLTEAGDL